MNDDEPDVRAKLTAAWRAVAARMIEAGYRSSDVYQTMVRVALSGVIDDHNQPPSGDITAPQVKSNARLSDRGFLRIGTRSKSAS
jgi:hypothetical protein